MTDKLFHEPANINSHTDSDMPSRLWMRCADVRAFQPSIDADQRTSISAMIAYISYRSGQSEFRIERELSDRFNVPNPKWLQASNFDEAIRYLADIISD